MKKNFEVDIPKGAEAEFVNKRELRTTIFTRTRIAALCLLLILSFGSAGTLAYLQYTTNQTPNRDSVGELEMHVVENVSDGTATTEAVDTSSTFVAGTDSKQVKIRQGTANNRADEKIRVSFFPVVESKENADANVAFNETWSALKTDDNGTYIETDIVKLYVDNVNDTDIGWTYDNDGTFTYNSLLKKGEDTSVILKGVTLADGVSYSDYNSIKVKVIADGIQDGTTDTW